MKILFIIGSVLGSICIICGAYLAFELVLFVWICGGPFTDAGRAALVIALPSGFFGFILVKLAGPSPTKGQGRR